MAISVGQNQSNNLAEINITPLCDVLLVLLIIFMVTAPLLTQGIDVNLPQAQGKEVSQTQDDIILTLRKENQGYSIFLGDKSSPVDVEYLEKQLRTTFEDKEKKDIFLRADQDIRYGDIAKVMAIAKLAGIQRIGMMTQPEGK